MYQAYGTHCGNAVDEDTKTDKPYGGKIIMVRQIWNKLNRRNLRVAAWILFTALEIFLILSQYIRLKAEPEIRYYFKEYTEEMGESSGKIYTENIKLSKGIYDVVVEYKNYGGTLVVQAQASEYSKGWNLYADRVNLPDYRNKQDFTIWVNNDVEDLRINVESDNRNDFEVTGVTIKTAGNSILYQIFKFTVYLAVLNLLVVLCLNRKRDFKYGIEALGILVIAAAASTGVLANYIIEGQDLSFHLLRIEGIKNGILSGQFPVRISPGWSNDWGYAVSTMCGEALLYFPAILRLLGVTVQNAYKCFVVMVNILTAVTAYYSFHKMTRDRGISFFAAFLYVMAPYRLSSLYVKAAVGEYSAMIFLPLVALAFWYVLEDTETQLTAGKVIAPVIGFTGLIQTQFISLRLTVVAIVVVIVLCFGKIVTKRTFMYAGKLAALTILLNFWFLVPYFRYLREDLRVKNDVSMSIDFQAAGARLYELLAVYHNNGMEIAKVIGSAFLAVLVLGMLLYHKDKLGRGSKFGGLCLMIAFFAFMSSFYFPYNAIGERFPSIGEWLSKIKEPYYFLGVVVILGGVLSALLMADVRNSFGNNTAYVLMGLVGILALFQGSQLIYSAYYTEKSNLIYDIALYDSRVMYSESEYHYNGSWGNPQLNTPEGMDVNILGSQKYQNRMEITYESKTEEAYIELPLYYYVGYVAYEKEHSDTYYKIERGDQNRIRVYLPKAHNGTIIVKFKEPVSYRVAELISILTIIGLLVKKFVRKRMVVR